MDTTNATFHKSETSQGDFHERTTIVLENVQEVLAAQHMLHEMQVLDLNPFPGGRHLRCIRTVSDKVLNPLLNTR